MRAADKVTSRPATAAGARAPNPRPCRSVRPPPTTRALHSALPRKHEASSPLTSGAGSPRARKAEDVAARAVALREDAAALGGPFVWIGDQKAHSTTARGAEVIEDMSAWAQDGLLPLLKDLDADRGDGRNGPWQPADFLPDPQSPDFIDQVRELRARSAELPAGFLVALVGDTITEEALPTYMNMLNIMDAGCGDATGRDAHGWAQWTRGWTAEENRHGEALNAYLYLGGRVDMPAVERTVQGLISRGMDGKMENNPYLCFVYTSFQERATRVSHGNTARLAKEYGDDALARLCGMVAADEARHEEAYKRIVEQVLLRDPDGAVLAFADMMRKGIVMPAALMDDGVHASGKKGARPGDGLFDDYAEVAQRLGVYTARDYADIVEHLVQRWGIADLSGLSGEAAEAQEYLVGHAEKVRRLADLGERRAQRSREAGRELARKFSWVFGEEISLL
ncbi:unnamed protein product [Pedinophyceae sp. YPF-701]|nr:unnamed protein product [Pedinophyceae sp. YPF-701]